MVITHNKGSDSVVEKCCMTCAKSNQLEDDDFLYRCSVDDAVNFGSDLCKRYEEKFLNPIIEEVLNMKIKENQVWRKEGPCGWLKIIQILDPEYDTYDGGQHGCIVHCYPDQLKGIQLRGGKQFFIADTKEETWELQIMRNRFILEDGWKRGDYAWALNSRTP